MLENESVECNENILLKQTHTCNWRRKKTVNLERVHFIPTRLLFIATAYNYKLNGPVFEQSYKQKETEMKKPLNKQ